MENISIQVAKHDDGSAPHESTTAAGERLMSPEFNTNIISQALFTWVNPMFKLSKQKRRQGKELEEDDLWRIPDSDTTKCLADAFETGWKKEAAEYDTLMSNKESYAALVATLWGMARSDCKLAVVLKLLATLCQLGTPVMLNLILTYISSANDAHADNTSDRAGEWEGYMYALSLAILLFGDAVFQQSFFQLTTRTGYQARSTVTSAVYRKSLRLSSSGRQSTTTGEIVNYMQLDATRIEGVATEGLVVSLGLVCFGSHVMESTIYFVNVTSCNLNCGH
jgi:ATP-binding cassette subfamily C (CFTR/MRP) protein 1